MAEEERDEWLAYFAEVCPSCGNLRSVCSDPSRDWFPQRTMCYATASRDLVIRRLRKKHEKKEPGTKDLHPFDGMDVWVSEFDLTPDDDFV